MEANHFGNNKGFPDRIYCAGESTDGGTKFALDTATSKPIAQSFL
jgi:hypothetical protein